MLSAQNMSFAYNAPGTSVPVLTNLELTVKRDERVALVAPSGFGKTTLCKLLAGYLQPAHGSILLNGKQLPKQGVCPVQMIWQHPEQVVDPRMRMTDVLAQAGSSSQELLDRLGIKDSWLPRYLNELSGGELQRFCIARALATNPQFLIADEITTMLDAITQAQIWQALLQEVQERNIGLIFVSHSPALTARIATRTHCLS